MLKLKTYKADNNWQMIVCKLNGGRHAIMTIIKTIMMNLIPSLYHGKTTVLYCNVVAYMT